MSGTDPRDGDDGSPSRERTRSRESERERDSRRPPRALQVAVAGGLGLVLLSVAALGVSVFVGGLAPGGIDVPQAEFTFEYDAAADTVTVEHVGGPALTTENSGRVYLAVNGTGRGVVPLPFEPGDARTVENVSAGQEVAVVWVAPDGDEQVLDSRVVGAN